MEDNWKQLAEKYNENQWPFSSSFAWGKVAEENPKPFHLLQFADHLRLSGDYSKAEEIFQKIELEEIPMKYRFVYHIRKGMLQHDQGEIDEAIESYRKSIEIGTDDTYPFILLAALLSTKSKLDEAEAVLTEALKKEGDIDEANYNLSLIYARKGNFKQAIKALKKCLSIDPSYPNATAFLNDFENMENKLLRE